MYVVQNESCPAEIQNALFDLMRPGVNEVRICSAYITLAGSRILFDGISRSLNGNEDEIRKLIVTSFDFGLTEPQALRFWSRTQNCEIRVAGAPLLARRTLIPRAAFHPKMYLFRAPDGTTGSLVSSANLTNRGLTVNTEVGWSERINNADQVTLAWDTALEGTTLLTNDILERYEAIRRRLPRVRFPEVLPVPSPEVGRPNEYQLFAEVGIDPTAYVQMWVQSLKMQGGAGTQLELPRGAHRFFGAAYAGYDYERVDHISEPTLIAGTREWRNRPVSWHGDNRMERINLPSPAAGGFDYDYSLILFRKLGQNRFELRVYPWNSDSAHAYVETSRRSNLLFRVGRGSPRLTGFLPS